MSFIALTRAVEPWSMQSLVGLALLVFVVFAAIYWLVSRTK